MTLQTRLTADMKAAMKAHDKTKLSVIRLLKAAMSNEEIKVGHPLTEDEALTVLAREMKQRTDEKAADLAADRSDLAETVAAQMAVLAQYLPTPLTNEELQAFVQETIHQVGAQSKADMGKVMGALMPKVKGRADGQVVNQLVMAALG